MIPRLLFEVSDLHRSLANHFPSVTPRLQLQMSTSVLQMFQPHTQPTAGMTHGQQSPSYNEAERRREPEQGEQKVIFPMTK